MNIQESYSKNLASPFYGICVLGLLAGNMAIARKPLPEGNLNQLSESPNSFDYRRDKHPPRDPQVIFDRWDDNEDGAIFPEEFRGPDEHFLLIDTDHSGELSLEEFEFAPVILTLDKMDDNFDGIVSAAEFRGPEEKFNAVDENGDRQLTSSELQDSVDHLRLHPKHHPRGLINRIDENGDGTISKTEFKGSDERFEMKDLDGDGFLTITELEKSFVARLLDRSDEDGDSILSLDEFMGTDERFDFLDADLDGFVNFEEILNSFN